MLLAAAAQEQLFVYMLNRARNDPVAYQVEQSLPVDLSYVTPRGPLAVNDSLSDSSGFHAEEMAAYNYFGHQSSVTGDWPNKMARDFGYQLPAGWSSTTNYIESIAAGGYPSYATPAAPLNALIVDAGVPSLGHRNHLLGIESFNADNREIGVGYGYNAYSTYVHYWGIHATRTDPSDRFLTGVAFNDLNANRRYDADEGLSGVTITAGALNTTTNAEGGWSIQAAAGTYSVTASGGNFSGTATSSVTVGADNVEVDFLWGQNWAIVDFNDSAPQPSSPVATAGLYNPANGVFYLKNTNASGGGADVAFRYGPDGNAGWTPLVGDWDGNGTNTAGLYNPATGAFYLKNTNASGGGADVAFTYGPGGNAGWVPIVGDFNGNSTDTVGLYNPATGAFYLKNTNASGGGADVVFTFGPSGNAGWVPIVGDWDANLTDTVGLYTPNLGGFYLKNANASGGGADVAFSFGPADIGWIALVGDWDGDGADTIGVYDPNAGGFHLKNANVSGGGADVAFSFGPGNLAWTPLMGDWDGPPAQSGAAIEELSGPDVALLAPAHAQAIVAEAFSRWDTTADGPSHGGSQPGKDRQPGRREIEAFFARLSAA